MVLGAPWISFLLALSLFASVACTKAVPASELWWSDGADNIHTDQRATAALLTAPSRSSRQAHPHLPPLRVKRADSSSSTSSESSKSSSKHSSSKSSSSSRSTSSKSIHATQNERTSTHSSSATTKTAPSSTLTSKSTSATTSSFSRPSSSTKKSSSSSKFTSTNRESSSSKTSTGGKSDNKPTAHDAPSSDSKSSSKTTTSSDPSSNSKSSSKATTSSDPSSNSKSSSKATTSSDPSSRLKAPSTTSTHEPGTSSASSSKRTESLKTPATSSSSTKTSDPTTKALPAAISSSPTSDVRTSSSQSQISSSRTTESSSSDHEETTSTGTRSTYKPSSLSASQPQSSTRAPDSTRSTFTTVTAHTASISTIPQLSSSPDSSSQSTRQVDTLNSTSQAPTTVQGLPTPNNFKVRPPLRHTSSASLGDTSSVPPSVVSPKTSSTQNTSAPTTSAQASSSASQPPSESKSTPFILPVPSAAPSKSVAFNASKPESGSANSTSVNSSVSNHNSSSWRNASCSTAGVMDATVNPMDRWNSVNATAAWKAAVQYATTVENTGGLSFPELISNFFHGPDQMHCEQLSARSACATESRCFEPASAYLILNSLVSISNFNYNLYSSISRSQASVLAQLGSFSSTFAAMEAPDQTTKVFLDVLVLAFALATSPLWNAAFKQIPFFKSNPNLLGSTKDWVNPAVSSGITLVKDASLSGAALNAVNSLSMTVGKVIEVWTDSIVAYNQNLFNGSQSSNDLLSMQIQDGMVLAADFTLDESLVTTQIERAIFSILIPRGWAISNTDIHPFILDSGAPCGTVNPIDSQYLNPEDGDKTWSCVNGKIYYILAVTGTNQACFDLGGFSSSCEKMTFYVPPGLSALDGQNFGGLTKDDIIAGAFNTYASNNNLNGAPPIDASSVQTLSEITIEGIRAPGIIQIPVCGTQEAYNNWDQQHTSLPNYPCN